MLPLRGETTRTPTWGNSMSKRGYDGHASAWPRSLGLAAALGAATFLAGAGAPAQALAGSTSAAASAPVSAKIEGAVTAALASGGNPDVIVKFRGRADVSSAFALADSGARATYVYEQLTAFASASQTQAVHALNAQFGLSEQSHGYTRLWIDNSIAIPHITSAMLDVLSTTANVESIRTQKIIPLLPEPEVAAAPWEVNDAVSSLAHIKVPDVWALGFKGAGVVVANIDSGVRYTHQALVGKYRGNLGGGTFDHNFNYYDPYNHAATPRNTASHGSHTMGTMIGDGGTATTQIGAAPDAKWIACLGFGGSGGSATDAGLLECGQWTLAPYPTTGSGTPDPTKHADIVNNSWGSTLCDGSIDDWYEGVVDNWIAAGIMPVFSAGNASNCGLPNNPPLGQNPSPGNYGKVFTIGSTGTTNGQYAAHSIKGPTIDPSAGLPTYPDTAGFPNLKPNVVSPGVSINSANNTADNAYFLDTGTSMSAPAVAGVTALMWSAAPCIKNNYSKTGTLIMSTATAIPVATGSPSDGPGNVPNQATGWGEINALAAVNAAIAFCASGTTAPTVAKAFAPASVATATPSTLTITLTNPNATAATLSAALTDTFPSGLVAAATPNAATTCAGGSGVSTTAGSVTLGTGAAIPVSGSCTISVDVTAATASSYVNTIAAGALQTDAGNNAAAATATLTVTGGGGANGVYHSPALNHVVPNNFDGTSFNLVSGAFDDTGPVSGPWDQNLWSSSGALRFFSVAGNGDRYVVSGSAVAALHVGDTVGPTSTFQASAGTGTPAAEWLAGTDAYAGFQFTCNGRLAFPVTGVCYGYVHITSGSTTGFPATVVEYSYDGDGNPITITAGGPVTHTVTPSVGTPSGTIDPAAAQTIDDGDTASFTLTPASGFHIDTVGGTCGGTLAGNSYTTDAVTADCTVIANFAANGSTNGIITSGPLNHAVMDNTAGTSLNIVTSAFDDTGPISGDWDYNFWDSSGLDFWVVDTHNAQFAVDGSGNALVFQAGDVIDSSLTFGGDGGSVDPVAAWLAGTDGYAGVKFDCDGRLTFPVPSTVCYGYIHITTTGTTGFPATIVDTAFDGDGNAITIVGGTPGNDPSATVTPTSLSFTVAANATATDTLNIANAAGSDPLTFTIAAQGTAKHPKLVPHATASKRKTPQSNPNLAPKLAYLEEVRNRPAATLARSGQRSTHRASSPWVPAGSIAFQLDDGSAEDSIGFGTAGPPATESGAVWINRFNATAALTVDSISIFWGDTTLAGGDLTGLQANLVVYYDADADGDASNAVRLGTDDLVTITTTGDFQTYTTNFSVPGAGDVYIGFVDQWALAGSFSPRLFPAAIDETASQGMSHLSAAGTPPTDIVNLGNNDNNGVIDDFGLPGNWLIRATGTGGGSGGPCTGPVVPWLTATPASGSVNGGSNTDVTITADPSAGTLDAGTYTAELCITTNDPTQALISVPVSLTVTAVAATPCNGGADEIFCDGFDGSGGGPFTQPVVDPSFEATTTDAGTNPDWDSLDSNAGANGGTVFYSATNFGIPVHTGDFAAWFGGWAGGGETQHFSQSVTLPNGGPLFINYFRQTAVAPDAPSNMVVSVDGTAVETTDLSTQLDSDFVLHSIDISTFADGGAHVIKFQYDYASGTADGNTFVDDVTIDQSSTPGKR